MTNHERAIVLAAGMGTRLVSGLPIPKPVVDVAGVPLIVRVLRGLEAAGVREVAIVVGYRRESIYEAVGKHAGELAVTFVENDDFEKPNGTSLLKAAAFVEGPTFVTMSDHLWAPSLIERVRAFPIAGEQSVLGIDRRIDRCFDLDDATKVLTDGDRIRAIGKTIADYDAIDTGVFRIGRALIDALRSVDGEQGCTLSQGVQALASRGDMLVADVGAAAWIDVDTPAMLAVAERLLSRFGERLDVPEHLTAEALVRA